MSNRRMLLLLLVIPPALVLLFWLLIHLCFLHERSSLEEALERDAEAYAQRDWSRAPAFGEPIPGNAVEYYAAAEEKLYEILDAMDPEFYAAGDAAREGWSFGDAPVPPSLAKLVDRLEPVFELVETGARAVTLKPQWDLVGPWLVYDSDEPYHPLNLAIVIEELAPVRAALLAERGEQEACVDHLLALDRLGDDTVAGTGLQQRHGGIVHKILALETAHALVSAGKITGPPLERLGAWLRESSAPHLTGWSLVEGTWLDE